MTYLLDMVFKTSLLSPDTPETTLLNQSSYSKFQYSCPLFTPHSFQRIRPSSRPM